MKKLEDMDKVSLTITDLNDGNIVYNSLLTCLLYTSYPTTNRLMKPALFRTRWFQTT